MSSECHRSAIEKSSESHSLDEILSTEISRIPFPAATVAQANMAELRRWANARPIEDKTVIVEFDERPAAAAAAYRAYAPYDWNNIRENSNAAIVAAFLASTPVPLQYDNMRTEMVVESDGIAWMHWRFKPAPAPR